MYSTTTIDMPSSPRKGMKLIVTVTISSLKKQKLQNLKKKSEPKDEQRSRISKKIRTMNDSTYGSI